MRSLALAPQSILVAALLALTACGSQPGVSASAPTGDSVASTFATAPHVKPSLVRCPTKPPQYDFIFEGACVETIINPSGGSFELQRYKFISLAGQVGTTNVRKPTEVYVVDAVDDGDIKQYQKEPFPAYTPQNGTTFLYAVAINEGHTSIEPVGSGAFLTFTITDLNGLPGTECAAAVLGKQSAEWTWTAIPGTYQANGSGDTVVFSISGAPSGVVLPSRTPVYFALYCFSGSS